MRLPSGSGLGQSSVGLVHAVCPHSDEPRIGGYGKRPKLMYLYFVPFHHHINLGSTVLYFFFLFFILAAFCSIPQLSPSDAVTFLVIASHRPYFFYPQPRLAMLLPRRDSRTVILGPGYVYLYIHFSLLHDCTASFPCILGLEQCLWGLGLRFRQGFTN